MGGEPLTQHLHDGLTEALWNRVQLVGSNEALHSPFSESLREPVPRCAGSELTVRVGVECRGYEPKRKHPLREVQRKAKRRLGSHRGAGKHRLVDLQPIEHSAEIL